MCIDHNAYTHVGPNIKCAYTHVGPNIYVQHIYQIQFNWHMATWLISRT